VSSLRGKRILVVEDEFFIATTTCAMLEELGARVVGPALAVSEALELAESQEIDLALLDINLHGQSSLGIADMLADRGIPVVFATGYSHGQDRDSAGRYMLAKPFTQDKLAALLTRALTESNRANAHAG
jgi:CheY-like chemotaxis protein